MDLKALALWLLASGAGEPLAGEVARANTARHGLDVLRQAGCLDLVGIVGQKMLAAARDLAGPRPELGAVILDYDGQILFEDTQEARQ